MKKKQILNAIYFLLASFSLIHFAPHTPWAIVLAFGLGTLGALAICATVNRSTSPSNYEFPRAIRQLLRATALVVPLAAIVAVTSLAYCSEYDNAMKLYDDGQYELAKESLDRVIVVSPDHEEALVWRAYISNVLENYNEALADANKAIKLNREDPEAFAEKAWALNKLKQFDDAYYASRRSLELNSTVNGKAWGTLADASRALGRLDEALEADNKHCEQHSTEDVAFEGRAETHALLGDRQASEADRRHAAELKDAED